jgi:hypothetical protein
MISAIFDTFPSQMSSNTCAISLLQEVIQPQSVLYHCKRKTVSRDKDNMVAQEHHIRSAFGIGNISKKSKEVSKECWENHYRFLD